MAQKYQQQRSFATNFKQSGYDANCIIPDVACKFKNIISVQGFGYSGSGALVDFFREYPKFAVLGYVDTNEEGGGFTPKTMQLSEIDFIRLAGGLFEIEKYLDSNNIFLNDALLNRTARAFGSSSLYQYYPKIRDLMHRFFANIVSLRLENLSQPYYNSYTVGLNETPDIYFLKKMSRQEFISICRNFLAHVFNEFYQQDKEYMALDQLLCDFDFNVERNLEYIPNVRMFLVTRDPRDTYAWAVKRNIEWMEHRSVESFIKWYQQFYKKVNYSLAHPNCMIVRYENFVLDYDTQERHINDYLSLEAGEHKLRQQYFWPEFSKRYVGIYKNMPEMEKEFSIIRNKLSYYCNPIID